MIGFNLAKFINFCQIIDCEFHHANIFFNTSIPTTVIILKKNRTNRDVYFIDASKEFDKGKNQNIMTDAHIEKILDAYKS